MTWLLTWCAMVRPTATRTAVFGLGLWGSSNTSSCTSKGRPTQSVLTWRYFNHISDIPRNHEHHWTSIFSTVHRDTQPIKPTLNRDVCCGWAPFVDAFAVRRDWMASCRWRSHLRWGWPSSATPGVVVSWGIAGWWWMNDDKVRWDDSSQYMESQNPAMFQTNNQIYIYIYIHIYIHIYIYTYIYIPSGND